MTIEEVVKKYEGVTELPPNKGWKQSWFEKLMWKVGWYKGAPWCCFSVKQFWSDLGYDHSLISGSTLQTYERFSKNKQICTVPKSGHLVFWRMYRNGKPTSAGHVGLITVVGVGISVMEGNTSHDKMDREGQGIHHKFYHKLQWLTPSYLAESRYTGLVLLGYVQHKILKK
jgi:hypothetical protein